MRVFSLSRRSLLAGIAGAFVSGRVRAAAAGKEAIYLSACSDGSGGHHVAGFTSAGLLLFATRLPARGHGVVVHPSRADAVVFARRPGDWLAVIDRRTGESRTIVRAAQGRHFYGHGTYSTDGRLLLATENCIGTKLGVLGVYDVEANYTRVDELPAHGIGPHDIAMMPGGRTLVVANGGLATEPDQGRRILNVDDPRPSLALIDRATGSLQELVNLGKPRRMLSIRHLDVRQDGLVAFACQYVGDPLDGPLLVGLRDVAGRVRMLDMPEDDLSAMDNYVGMVAFNGSGTVLCATSPRGGRAAFWDVIRGRYLGTVMRPDVCGVAPTTEAFMLTSGNDGVSIQPLPPAAGRRLPERLREWVWDNHLRRVS